MIEDRKRPLIWLQIGIFISILTMSPDNTFAEERHYSNAHSNPTNSENGDPDENNSDKEDPYDFGIPQPKKCIVDSGNRTHWLGAVMAFGATGQYGAEYSYSVWQRAELNEFNCNYAHMSVGVGGYGLRKNSKFRGGFPYISYEAKGTFLLIGASIQSRLGVVLHSGKLTPAAAVSVSFTSVPSVLDIGYTLQVSLGSSQPEILGQHLFHIDLNIPVINAGTLFPPKASEE